MFRVAWRSLSAHKSRLVLSTIAVVLGVAFVSGSFVFSDTLKKVFTDLFGQTTSDVVVTPYSAVGGQNESAAVTLPTSYVPRIEAVDGVVRAEGEVSRVGVIVVGADGKAVSSGPAPQLGLSWAEGEDSPLNLIDGRGPEREGEIAIDSQTAENGELAVGQEVGLVLPSGPPRKAEVVGVFRFGNTGSLAGAALTTFDLETAQKLLTEPGRVTSIAVSGEDGISQTELASRVKAALPKGVVVKTGDETADEAADAINSGLSFFNYLILAFAAIALLVGIFLIINTFAMLVAQRTRELALLRALGASRRQVTRSVMVEALVVGLIGSTAGFFLGIGLAVMLSDLLTAFGIELPGGDLVIAPRTVIVAYLVGVLVTLAAAWFPARRAAKLPPVAAMRDTSIPSRSLRIRTIIGAVMVVIGVLALIGGVRSEETAAAASLVGLGALLTLVGVAVAAPVLARPLVAVVGWPVRRISTITGRIAVDNAGRNRARTAGTASALMIGLAVVGTFTVLGTSATASVDETIDASYGAEYIISDSSFTGFSPEVADAVRDVEGVSSVTSVGFAPVKVNGSSNQITTIDPATGPEAFKIGWDAGGWDALTKDAITLDAASVARDDKKVGDKLEVTFATGVRTLTLAGIYDAKGLTGYVASNAVLEAAGIPETPFGLYIKLDPGVDAESVRPALDAAVQPFPNVKLESRAELKESTRTQINGLLAFIYVLLALSILIAILGIVNTLALSVVERTREIGLLRAVGMSRKQVKRMIRWESVVIAVIGALLGLALGVVFGSALQNVLASQGITTLSIPWGQLVSFAVIAGLVGVLAAWRPGARAAKLDVLKAIATD